MFVRPKAFKYSLKIRLPQSASHTLQWIARKDIIYIVHPHFYIHLHLKTVKQGIILPRRVKILFCLTFYYSVSTLGNNGSSSQIFCIIPSCVSLNPLKAKLNTICPLLTLFGAHNIFHVSRLRVNKHRLFPH
jgi:hypothetical protein